MDFFKVAMFRKPHKPKLEQELEDKPVPQPEEPKDQNSNADQSENNDADNNDIEDDDDDFIVNEVKRRLKELRRNSFMVLIPEEEETCPEEEEDEENDEVADPCEWRDVEAEGRQWWGGFDALYEKYCERMLFFDKISVQQLKESVPPNPSTPSRKYASKKLTSPLRCLSLKKFEEPEEETEHLQQPECEPYQDLETAYVGHLCLTWEALHCQYSQLCQKISYQIESSMCYSHSAQLLQQFQVLLQRFIENEPFEQGPRPEIYARVRNSLPKLLQAPNIKGSDQKQSQEESEFTVLATDVVNLLENTILTFQLFVKMDKKKVGVLHKLGNQNHMATPLHQVQSSLEKRAIKLKEMRKKRKGWKKKDWPQTCDDIQLLFGLIEIKILSRVLRMARISKEQLFWCEEKMKKLDLSSGKLQRDPSPLLFPC
ncbi:hypothetical protein ACFE04_031590 [Oxalis oulophora]